MAWTGDPEAIPSNALLLYDATDAVLASWHQQHTKPPQLQSLHEGYKLLLSLATDTPPLASWRAAGLNPHQLKDWLCNQQAMLQNPGLVPEANQLAALLIRPLLQAEPGLLDSYLDLELKAELAGGAPDSNYLARLQSQLSPEALLTAWWQPSAEANKAQRELKDAREEAELTLLQLHQVQEELEHIFLADRNKQEQITALQTTNQQLEQRIPQVEAELEKSTNNNVVISDELAATQQQLVEAREEAELTLLQLHQVQEELEHYFLLARRQQQLLASHEQLGLRSEQLLSGLIKS